MAKILLIQAAVHKVHIERAQPLGLLCLASYLRRTRGDEIKIYDMRLAWKQFDLATQAFKNFQPDLVGISAHGVDAPAMHQLARQIKSISPQTPVICGGVHVTSYWQDVLEEDKNIDCAVIGEGELTFKALVDAIETCQSPANVEGIAFRENGHATKSFVRPFQIDLDFFPLPSWDLIDIDAYGKFPRIGIVYKHPRYMVIETARGCPFFCAWCHRSMGEKFRPHSPEYVMSMLEALVKEHQVKDVLIIDDLFNFKPDRVDRIFELIIEKGLKIAVSIPNGLRADLISEKSLNLWKKAGVYRIMIAVETASSRLQKEMGKNLALNHTLNVIKKATELGISVHGNFIIGLPMESKEEIWETIRFAARSPMDTFGLYRAIPFKGTALYEMAKAKNIDLPKGEAIFSIWDLKLNLSSVPLKTINRARKLAYPLFYLRPKRLYRLLLKMPNRFRLIPFMVRFFFKKLVSE